MKKRALLILAEGFEEIEAVSPIDILRRCGVELVVAGLGGKNVKSARGLIITADKELDESDTNYDAVILPGGLGGAQNLANSNVVDKILTEIYKKGGILASICASPSIVFSPKGFINNKKSVCYPGMQDRFPDSAQYVEEDVVVDGNIITSKGPATSTKFAFKIAEKLVGKDVSDKVAKAMLFIK